jgi:uncharacterized repeat protein (TIGR01451 family)
MFKQLPLRKVQQYFHQYLYQYLRHHWLVALCIVGFTAVIFLGAPAWAAPVQQGGTVPRPTPTSEGDPVATATPQPDDEGESEATATPEPVDPNAPNITFPTDANGNPTSDLTAQVTVDGLNVREGPATTFNTLGTIPANTQVTVLSRSEDNAWWYICCLPGTQTTGWASAQLLAPDFDVAQATTLIPVFGTAPVATATAAPAATTQSVAQAAQPLSIAFQIDPYFVWQGITATLTITVNNPNTVDAANVLLSDEVPAALTLVEATADAGGTVETITAASGQPLLLFRWATIPADTAVTATIVTLVSQELTDGQVIDNLVAVRASNVAYSASAVTIGMPPTLPPDFQ